MAEFDNKTREIVQRLQAIRVKMLREQPFYAVLLMHLRFALDESTPTLYTDGERIAFNPYFVDELDDLGVREAETHMGGMGVQYESELFDCFITQISSPFPILNN